MKKKNIISIKVVQMDIHFLYLPFYYAQRHNFFGYIPKRYEIEKPILPRFPHTDQTTFEMLMESENVHFAICDPIQILSPHSYDRKPAVLASLVTNSAFWAVDHKTHVVKNFKDIAQYDKVISYHPGTTSYSIAKNLHNLMERKVPENEFIITVPPRCEIQELLRSSPGTIALSPNPFDIENLIENGGGTYNINLCLGKTPEYHNVLVTALLGRADFVNKHPELVNGLLKAIQRALLLIVDENVPDVLTFIKDFFSGRNHATGALRMALDSRVFPASIVVDRAEWQYSVRANSHSKSEADNDKSALDAFEKYIDPYLHISQSAYNEEKIKPIKINIENKFTKFLYPTYKWAIALAVSLLGFLLHSYLIPIILFAGFLVEEATLYLFDIVDLKNINVLHKILWTIFVILLIILVKNWFPESIPKYVFFLPLFPVQFAIIIHANKKS